MSHHSTVFSQFLKLVPRHEFEQLARAHHSGRSLRAISRWDQFVALTMGQLAGRQSLRDVIANLSAQATRLYHLGCQMITRSTLARVNQNHSYKLYQSLFTLLYQRCSQQTRPGHGFRFKNKLFSLDASLIDLSLAIFPWADYNRKKSALKLHLGLDHDGYIPCFATITSGKCGDLTVARTLKFKPGSIVVIDKGYIDYQWWQSLDTQGVYFVCRPRKNANYRVTARRAVRKATGLTCDQNIQLTGVKATQTGMPTLRRVGYRCPDTGKKYVFISNNFKLAAKTIAGIYKSRWQVELFFKWIKQNLKIKTFLGTSKNAIMTQVWIALCSYLILAYLKFSAKLAGSLQQITRLLQLNLFLRRDLLELLSGRPPDLQPDRQRVLIL